jgi:hypothetical protein
MRRLLYLSLAALTFFAGLLAYGLWQASPPSPGEEPPTVSFCELGRDPQLYDGKMIRVKAGLFKDTSEPYIYDWSCGAPNAYTAPPIGVSDDLNLVLPDWAVPGIFCRSSEWNESSEGINAEVVVIGTFVADSFVPGAFPGARHPRIIAKSVYQISLPSNQH